jgi:hypothetical protein
MNQQLFKVHHDGSHYVATFFKAKDDDDILGSRNIEDDLLFEELYFESVKLGYKGKRQLRYIIESYNGFYDNVSDFSDVVENLLERKKRNIYKRKNRFYRKAFLNRFNYFVTFTYDNKLHESDDSFKKSIKKCLSNLHTRRGWNYMGAFEYGEEGRLHFHGLIYIPDGQLVGEFIEKSDYSVKKQCIVTRNENTWFRCRFGRNDFQYLGSRYELSRPVEGMKNKNIIEYILKYIEKEDNKIVYSRSIPSEIMISLNPDDAISAIIDSYVNRYVLFDDVICDEDIEKFIGRKSNYLC